MILSFGYISTTPSLELIDKSLYEQIMSLKDLPDGWDYGSGTRPNSETIFTALEMASILISDTNNYFSIKSAPLTDGGIALTLFKNDDFVDLLIKGNSITLNHEKGIGEDFNVITVIEDAKYLDIIRILLEICNSSGLYTSENTIETKEDLTIGTFSTPSMMGYPYSISSARSSVATTLYASI